MRLTREQARAETRERLIEAAERVFARRGFHGASVDEVAEEAGFSTGALYSNFAGKEDLFLALLERHATGETQELSKAVADLPTVEERVREGAGQWMGVVDREPHLVLLYMEFWAYAARDPELRPRFATHFASVRAALAEILSEGAGELDVELLLPPEEVATALQALADGIALQKMVDPGAVSDDLFARLLSLIFAGLSRDATG